MIPHLIKKKANQPFSQKHKAFCPALPIQPPTPAAKGLKSGKEARPAEQDGGRGEEGFINSDITSEGRAGKRVDGQRLGSRKGSSSLYSV